MNKYFQRFGKTPIILPVVGIQDIERAKANADTAVEQGCPGIFVINNAGLPPAQFVRLVRWITTGAPPGWFIGVNPLVSAARSFDYVSPEIEGLWTDDANIDERRVDQPDADAVADARAKRGWTGLYFGGVAFKYRREVTDVRTAARIAAKYVDVVTTSGPGTGHPPEVSKLRAMKSTIGAFPLAVASGVSSSNIKQFLPQAQCYLIATGIRGGDGLIDSDRLSAIQRQIRDPHSRPVRRSAI